MSAVTIRRLSDKTHERLRLRAERSGRSTEAEIRAILDEATQNDPPPLGLGSEIRKRFMAHGGVDLRIPARTDRLEPAQFD
jgi:antitoxin FitA